VTRPIAAIITAITGDRIIVGEEELIHAMRHFFLPKDIFLELLERVLKEPTDVFTDSLRLPHEFLLFYRLDRNSYLLAIVKVTSSGSYLASMYPTGRQIRGSHRKLKRVKI
jgi:hypothetical protein